VHGRWSRLPLLLLLCFVLFAGAGEKPGLRVLEDRVFDAGLNYPTDLCAEGRGRVWIADGLNRRLVVLEGESGKTRSVACDSFARPLGLDVFQGRVYVADPRRHGIHVLDTSGRWLKEIRLPAVCDPVDVLALEKQLVVSDNDNHRLLVLTKEGRLVKVIGKGAREYQTPVAPTAAGLGPGETGDLVGEFTYPGLLTRTAGGFMVVDVLGARIQVFSASCRFDRLVGGFSTDGTGLFRPKGCVSNGWRDGALVVDGYTGMVCVYDDYGDYAGRLERDGKVWRLEGPTAIARDPENLERLWVLDCRASRVHRIRVP
jgi:hypothetical protein